MALHRSSLSARRGSKNDSQKDGDESENNGYVQILVKPLEQNNCSFIYSWLGCTGANFTTQQVGIVYGFGLVILSIIVYQLLKCDLGFIFQRMCGIIVPIFTIVCVFYWLSLFLRKTWSTTSVYILFSSCYLGETFALLFLSSWRTHPEYSSVGPENSTGYVMQPSVIFVVLLVICTASVFSTLETSHSVVVISLVSFTRFLACSMLRDLPYGLRPFIAYSCGLTGIIVSKYMETVLKPPINNFMTHDGKIPVIKRRRSSSSSSHAFSANRSTRRTSLPALIPKSQSSSAGYESAIIGEAHGLITDMLVDNSLPPHIISGLRAVSNLLKGNNVPIHKQRVSPLVSLAESSSYGSDTEESPYTGERPSSLPKRLRRSLPPNLIRRMSASTWTTTTSATGMPTLEPEPCRIRSSSFRHSRDNTPGSSPVGSRSSSPSPSSPTVVLTIPKSRSFSLASPTPMVQSHAKRLTRKSMAPSVPISEISAVSPGKNDNRIISPLAMAEVATVEEGDRSKSITVTKDQFSSIKRFNITSDYESSDSPNSSDHSDTVLTADDLSGSPPKKVTLQHSLLINVEESPDSRVGSDTSRVVEETAEEEEEIHNEEEDDGDDGDDDDDEEDVEIDIDSFKKSEITSKDKEYLYNKQDIKIKEKEKQNSVTETSESDFVPWDISEVDDSAILQTHCLSNWDYPIFELADKNHYCILSKVAYKLFMEVGLFETFRIPLKPFIQYFHALEMGYRDKPYHNRVHATDVLHGVYYMTTQPIPGFTQVNTSDMFSRHGSSSESESDNIDRTSTYRTNNFSADDSYGIMGGNFPALELMALYTAAAMHDYDHPGRTNAFLVATNAPQAILYNDRSVLENHHAAAAWNLFLSTPNHNFLCGLEQTEFKRFRFLVIDAILATDLKRHFEILAEFNAKVNDDDAAGIDWTVETDRHLVIQMVIKLADINGPAKQRDLHMQWTTRISEEFYDQGDEEAGLGMPISPYMDRQNGQLAKLQETFINHLVSPLCNSLVTGGLLPGTWVEDDSEDGDSLSDTEKGESACKDTEDDENDETDPESGSMGLPKTSKRSRKINCLLTKNLKENHEIWVAKIEQEKQAAAIEKKDMTPVQDSCEKTEMEPIKEESESPVSPSSISESDATNADENCDSNQDGI